MIYDYMTPEQRDSKKHDYRKDVNDVGGSDSATPRLQRAVNEVSSFQGGAEDSCDQELIDSLCPGQIRAPDTIQPHTERLYHYNDQGEHQNREWNPSDNTGDDYPPASYGS